MRSRIDPSQRAKLARADLLARALTALALLAATGFSAVPVHAEKGDREKPINIVADRVTADDAAKVSVFEGKVVLTQGTFRLEADKLTVREDKEGFQHATALGNPATFRQKRDGVDEYIDGRADRIEYDNKKELVQLYGKAELKRGQDDLRSDYISYDAKSELFQAKSGETPTSQGRVRVVIQPKTKSPPEQQPAVPLKPSANIKAQ